MQLCLALIGLGARGRGLADTGHDIDADGGRMVAPALADVGQDGSHLGIRQLRRKAGHDA